MLTLHDYVHEHLSEKGGPIEHEAAVRWFEEQRGIRKDTLDHFGVKFSGPEDAPVVTLPYSNGEKTRKGLLSGERKFFFTQGVKPGLFKGQVRKATFLVEGETDTMRLQQELSDAGADAGVVGISGIHTWRPELVGELADAERIYVVLDNDEDYMVRAEVDKAWKQIRHDLGTKARRVRLPNQVKDVCEFFDNYDLASLSLLVQRGSGQSRYKALDLTQPPPPPKWLVEGMVSLGDVTLTPGPPGLGKSWWTMGLATSVAEGWGTFLGADVLQHGRVLYVDQENPDDVIFRRLHKLGLTQKGHANIRYLWNQGIRLDRDYDDFLEEAREYEPTLIVLDSLTRLHTQDENSAGAMSAVFNDGIQPLARDTGAAVVLIHHDSRAGNPRGSIDIEGSVDNVLHFKQPDAFEANPGVFVIRQGKSRRRLGGNELVVKIQDRPDESVVLVPSVPLDPPF